MVRSALVLSMCLFGVVQAQANDMMVNQAQAPFPDHSDYPRLAEKLCVLLEFSGEKGRDLQIFYHTDFLPSAQKRGTMPYFLQWFSKTGYRLNNFTRSFLIVLDAPIAHSFRNDIDPRMFASGLAFWLSSLQYGEAGCVMRSAVLDSNVSYIELLAIMYLKRDQRIKQIKKKTDIKNLTNYFNTLLLSFESEYSALRRLSIERSSYEYYLLNREKLDKFVDVKDHMLNLYWSLIQERKKNRRRWENEASLTDFEDGPPKRLTIAASIAFFTMYRLFNESDKSHKSALSHMLLLEQTSHIDVRIDELTAIYEKFLDSPNTHSGYAVNANSFGGSL